MLNVLFDHPEDWKNLLPLSFTRSVADMRVGMLTLREKWKYILGESPAVFTQDYLQPKYPFYQNVQKTRFINASLVADKELHNAIDELKDGEKLVKDDILLAAHFEYNGQRTYEELESTFNELTPRQHKGNVHKISYPWDIFKMSGYCIENDIPLLSSQATFHALSGTNTVIGKHPVFVEDGVIAEACIFNTSTGPIYLRNHSEVMEGSMIRGPFVLGEHAVVKMGAKIYGPTVIGPHCKVGGEINNSTFFGYSNKAHDGFIGNSVIGEWCNLGADSNNSNLKNNYGNVKVYNYNKNNYVDTGLQFCGLIMADHAKCGINTMFNTGTVVGVGANVFDGGFPPKFVPSFAWGGKQGFDRYELSKFIETAESVMKRRDVFLEEEEREILAYIHHKS